MTQQDAALAFLREHQPMPKDEDLSEEQRKKYDRAIKHFLRYPNIEAVPLFLNSFGDIDGKGLYKRVEAVIRRLPDEEVVPYLKESLASEHYSVRFWSVQIASSYPSAELLPLHAKILQEDAFNIKYNTLTALSQFKLDLSRQVVTQYLEWETDVELRKIAADILNS